MISAIRPSLWQAAGLLSGLTLSIPGAHASVVISSVATKNMICADGVCAPTAQDATLNASDLETLLASGNATVTTKGSDVQARTIKVDAALSWSSTGTLSLDANRAIAIDKPIVVLGTGGVSLSDKNGAAGAIYFEKKGSIAFKNLSSSLSVEGKTLENSVSALASAVELNPSGYFALAGNYNAGIDGSYKSSPVAATFTGIFEGLGNTISNLTVTDADKQTNIGLFAEIGPGGAVNDLGMPNIKVKAASPAQYVGGIAGVNVGSLIGDYVSGKIIAGARSYVGALAGNNSNKGGEILRSFAATTVKGGNAAQAGGLVGLNGGTIETSHATGAVFVTGKPSLEGGLVGDNIGLGIIKESWATGAVSGGQYAGGLVGSDDGHIYNSYATGNVESPYRPKSKQFGAAGGLAGLSSDTIFASYSTGSIVNGSDSHVGGFVGFDLNEGGIASSYWDTDTSGITDLGQGAGNIPNDPGITGLSTAQFQSGLPAGFDPSVWNENPNVNGGLPYLLKNPPS
jgi:hypothetical protein